MVMGLTGAVPEVGTTADAAGHRFRVAAMAGRRIRRVAVTPIPEEPPRAEEP
jgi:CBS domain containing-hemolysin-like protein